MKSVLVHINRDAGQESRFQAALDIVRASGGHLTCMQASSLEAYVPTDPYGVSYLMAQTFEQLRKEADAERAEFETRLKGEGVSWDWHTHTGLPARLLADHSWLTDVVVVSLPGKNWPVRLETPPTAADVVMRAHAPVLAVPDSVNGIDCGGVAVVAWNGSPEASLALRAALPLLRLASGVVLVTVGGERAAYDFPPTEAASYLSRHGINAEIAEMQSNGNAVSEVLLEAARQRNAAYLVMGAYGHSRLRESIMGGVTRDMLEKADLPLLLAH